MEEAKGGWVESENIEKELHEVQSIPVPTFLSKIKLPDFSDLMTLVTAAISSGKLKREEVLAILKPFGIPSLAVVC